MRALSEGGRMVRRLSFAGTAAHGVGSEVPAAEDAAGMWCAGGAAWHAARARGPPLQRDGPRCYEHAQQPIAHSTKNTLSCTDRRIALLPRAASAADTAAVVRFSWRMLDAITSNAVKSTITATLLEVVDHMQRDGSSLPALDAGQPISISMQDNQFRCAAGEAMWMLR